MPRFLAGQMIQLDGSRGEGGGSLTRTALALSALTGKEFRITNIRAGRPQPGLKAQHLQAIRALARICGATASEVELGSTELHFRPGKLRGGNYAVDIGTAGSITLLLQALILPCLFAPRPVTLKITGGTSGKWQAGVDYLQNILLPHLQRFVEKIELRILKRGYFPSGGGEVELRIVPRFHRRDFETFESFWEDLQRRCPIIQLSSRGKLEQVKGIINLSQDLQEKQVAERIRKAALHSLQPLQVPVHIRLEYAASRNTGGEVILWAVFGKDNGLRNMADGAALTDYDNPVLLGSDVLLEAGKRSEEIGREVADKLNVEISSGAAADFHLADQLVMFMALLPGSAVAASSVTEHARTNMYVAEQFLPVQFKVESNRFRVEKRG